MKQLGNSCKLVYDYLLSCNSQGRVPSVREICEATGLHSTSTVHAHLKTLESNGLIEREKGCNRCIKINKIGATAQVPLVGKVTAGLPILAIEEVETYIPISESFRRGRNLFALRIVGESMKNAGIYDGDIVIVNQTNTAENGDIVVALIDEEATVKRFFKEDGRFRLQPENDAFEPIITDNLTILGKVVSLLRYY